MSAVNFITSLARKILARESKGIPKIPTQMAAEAKAGEIAARLQDAGLPLNRADEFIKSEQDLVRILNMIESTPPVMREVPSGIRSTREAKVFDMQGKEIKDPKNIMGGKEINQQTLKEGLMKIDNPFSDLVKTTEKGPKTLKQREAEVLEQMNKNNKETVQRIKNRKMVDDAIDNASPGFAGDRKYDAQLVADDLAEKRFGKEFYDLDEIDQMELYDEAYQGLSKQRFKNRPSEDRALEDFVDDAGGVNPDDPRGIDDFIPDPEDFAQGGIARLGLKEGSGMTRRSFLKILGGLAAVPIVGKFFKLAKVGKTVTKVPIIKTGDVPGKPEWFDALVNKVILEGDDVTKRFATQERQVVHMKKIDDDTSVTVTQDLNDGSIMVDVDDPIRNVMGEGGDDTSVTMMLKKGQADEMTKGTPPDEFSFTENDMRNYMDGPDDYTTEFTDNTVNKMSDLTSDLGKIKSYATGKGPTMKQIVESKKRKDMVRFAEENPSEYAANRGPEFDPDYDDYASGGIARMLGE